MMALSAECDEQQEVAVTGAHMPGSRHKRDPPSLNLCGIHVLVPIAPKTVFPTNKGERSVTTARAFPAVGRWGRQSGGHPLCTRAG